MKHPTPKEKRTVIGTFFSTLPKAKYFAKKKIEMWRGKIDWYIVKMKDGYLVVSESQINAGK